MNMSVKLLLFSKKKMNSRKMLPLLIYMQKINRKNGKV